MKASRIALLTAAQLCWVLLAGGRVLAADAHAAWSDLWRTPDQQGQALLDAGDPAAAAGRFRDPRRRAYADLQANRYAEAASLLAPFSDVQSEYNRGNALAKANQLQAALATYDAALKQSPGDRDIRHNRDLVARALQKQQQQSPKSTPGNGGQKGGKPGSSGQQQNGSGAQQSGAGGKQSAGKNSPNGSQPGGDAMDRNRQQSGQSGADTAHATPEQAQRDAAEAAALARAQQQREGNSGRATAATRSTATRPGARATGKGPQAPGTATPKQQPENERQLALDQWLRQIPDSPAGLLQRKFLIEHMMKEQEAGADPQAGTP